MIVILIKMNIKFCFGNYDNEAKEVIALESYHYVALAATLEKLI